MLTREHLIHTVSTDREDTETSGQKRVEDSLCLGLNFQDILVFVLFKFKKT